MEGFIERNQQQSDSTKQKMRSIVSQVNFDDLAARLSDVYQKQVAESDVDRCISFIDSPLGQKFSAAVKTSEFMRDSGTFFRALDANEQRVIVSYMSGNCVLVNLPNRSEAMDVFDDYFSGLVCSHLYQIDRDAYAKLEREGHCQG
ncbi:DUF2059 domain-containing protein [Lysobacter psychrotolerans]|uniref:DUF2059 domain-containing protein n=2 Tax=Montanilutibacter psychrotolerans TaxID=1327343 RepID=A0A3M8T1L5_9GAMM|nr:DUF2059 domain-containing protein [Lysobacter psychrotolerans]